MIATRNYVIGATVAPSFSYSLNAYEQKASEVYLAHNSIKDGTTSTLAKNGESVSTIVGAKGVRNLNYGGVPAPTIYGRKPWLNTTSSRDFIAFKNAPDAFYASPDFYKPNGDRQYYYYDEGGYACTYVIMLMQGQSSEAWVNDYATRNYAGELNGKLRVHSDGAYIVEGDSLPIKYQYTVLHIEYKKPNIEVWKNGIYVGSVANNLGERTGNYGDLGKMRDAIGVYTNSADFNFYAMYQWYTPEMAYLTANRNPILASIGEKWLAGTMETKPYAKDLTTNFNTSTQQYSVAFTPMNATSQQISNTNYQWYMRKEAGTGAFAPQILVGTGSTLPKSAIQTYINNNEAIWLNCQVEVGGAGTWTTCASPYTTAGITT